MQGKAHTNHAFVAKNIGERPRPSPSVNVTRVDVVTRVAAILHLEATEWIVSDFKVIEDAARSVVGVSRASTPLAAAAATTVHSPCSCVAHMFRVA
jgi:hypothetical protein